MSQKRQRSGSSPSNLDDTQKIRKQIQNEEKDVKEMDHLVNVEENKFKSPGEVNKNDTALEIQNILHSLASMNSREKI